MTVVKNAESAVAEATTERASWIKSVRAAGSWLRPMRTHLAIRQFEFVTDQPVVKGGLNEAPTPLEFIAGAVNGCITVTIESVAAELNIPLNHIETLTRAHVDVRGFAGTADVSPHFSDYLLLVQVVTAATEPELTELSRLVEKRCPAVCLLQDAGVALDVRWQFSSEPFAPLSDDRNQS